MRALVVESFNRLPTFAEMPTPSPGPGEVTISVIAVGLNFADLLMCKGEYQATPALPFALGLELVGRISAVGHGVSDHYIGQRVAAQTAGGALAETVIVPLSACWTPPVEMPDEVAAGFQIAYGTSHLALFRRARMTPDDRLVVLGAAGGVGLTAVEIAAATGVEVIAVARGADRLAVAKAAGATHLIDSAATPDLRQALLDLGGTTLVYDAIGGALGLEAFRSLASEGRHLLIGFASGGVPALKLNHALVKNIDLIGIYWGSYADFAPGAMSEALTELGQWYSDGKLTPTIADVMPFEGTLDALERLRRRDVSGKIVISLQSAR